MYSVLAHKTTLRHRGYEQGTICHLHKILIRDGFFAFVLFLVMKIIFYICERENCRLDVKNDTTCKIHREIKREVDSVEFWF